MFLNASDMGRVRGSAVGGGVVHSLMRMGASAVIAPEWPVKDIIAYQFALEFYAALSSDPLRPFADILRDLRALARTREPRPRIAGLRTRSSGTRSPHERHNRVVCWRSADCDGPHSAPPALELLSLPELKPEDFRVVERRALNVEEGNLCSPGWRQLLLAITVRSFGLTNQGTFLRTYEIDAFHKNDGAEGGAPELHERIAGRVHGLRPLPSVKRV